MLLSNTINYPSLPVYWLLVSAVDLFIFWAHSFKIKYTFTNAMFYFASQNKERYHGEKEHKYAIPAIQEAYVSHLCSYYLPWYHS
jgi:hypothetical protein